MRRRLRGLWLAVSAGSFKHVKKGKHSVTSKAVNSQGTADPTPATRKVKIKH